jgi:hypothetical protein
MLANRTEMDKLTPSDKSDICTRFFDAGRTKNMVEGHDQVFKAGKGIAKFFLDLKASSTPATKRALQATQLIKIGVPAMEVIVLSDREPNAADLAQIDNSVNIRKIIEVARLGKSSDLVFRLCWKLSLLFILTIFV